MKLIISGGEVKVLSASYRGHICCPLRYFAYDSNFGSARLGAVTGASLFAVILVVAAFVGKLAGAGLVALALGMSAVSVSLLE
jgi:hypothetical protein